MSDSSGMAAVSYGNRLAHHLMRAAVLMGMVAALVGAGHLAAWLGGYLTQRGLTAIIMKTNTALCLTLVGVALMLLVPPQARSAWRWAARVCAALALFIGLLTLIENLSGWGFGIDQLLAVETPGALAVVVPNRMGTPASLSFTLTGLALLILSRRDHRGARVVQALALLVCLITLLSTIGFLYGAEQFYGIAQYTAIAWPTAVALLLMGLGLLCARPAEGLMAQVTANDPGGFSLRRLLPAFVILPLLLGWLRLVAERAGIFDAATGTGMMVLLSIVLFSVLICHAGRRASRSAQALRESEARFRSVLDNARDVIYRVNVQTGRYEYISPSAEAVVGYTPDELMALDAQTLLRMVHPEDQPALRVAMAQVEATGQGQAEYRLQARNGRYRWLSNRMSLVRDGDGRPLYRDGGIRDITDAKLAQEALRERMKELCCLYAVSRDIQEDFSLEELCRRTVEHMVPAMRFPEITAAVLELNGKRFTSENYIEGLSHGLQAAIRVESEVLGHLRVCYTQERPFLIPEEQNLVNGVAEALSVWLQRSRTDKALRESEERLAAALEIAKLSIWEYRQDTGLIEFDQRSSELFGAGDRRAMTLDEFLAFVHEEDRQQVATDVGAALDPAGDGLYDAEYRIVRSDGVQRWLAARGHVTFTGDGQDRQLVRAVGTVMDITERKQAEEALRQSERFIQSVAQASPHWLYVFDFDSRSLSYANRSIMGDLGYPLDVQRAALTLDAFRASMPAEEGPHLARLMEEWQTLPDGQIRADEYCLRRADGELQYFAGRETVFARRADGTVQRILGLLLDITDRKRAEEALRELNATLESKVAQRTAELQRRAKQLQKLALELSQAEERERRRIALILHEDLQQQIAGAKFQLSALKGRPRQDSQRVVESIEEMLREAIEKSRGLSHDLSPTVLHMNDLAEALRWLANRVQAQQGLIAHVDVPGTMTLQSEALMIFLFRAAQEMLFNVAKHARTKEATIRVRRLGRYVCLSVSDQGRGFDPRELKETPGFGLFSIRERTELLGGRMRIDSAIGRGSRFRIVVPDGPKTEDSTQGIAGVGPRAYPIPSASGNHGRQEGAHGGPPLRVLVVDDHEMVRQGLASLLQESPDIAVVG